jgi:hypothetical protein
MNGYFSKEVEMLTHYLTHKGNENQNYTEITSWSEWISSRKQAISILVRM